MAAIVAAMPDTLAALSPPLAPVTSLTSGLVLAFVASASNNIGKALQKSGTRDLPRMSLERKVLVAYARHPTWRLGFAADVAGAVMMLFALQAAPLSLVQPIAGSGMAVLALFSHYYLHEELRRIEWLGVLTAGLGAVGVGVVAAPTDSSDSPELTKLELTPTTLLLLLGLLIALVSLEVLVRAVAVREKAPICEMGSGSRALHEFATGLQAGIMFGLSAAASRCALLLSMQFAQPILIPVGIGCSVLLTSAGFFMQARGLKDGRAVVVCTYAAISTLASGVLVGVLALSEPLPETGAQLAAWWASMLMIAFGVGLLVRRDAGTAFAKHEQ